MLEELDKLQRLVADKNRHLAELYDAAHHFVDQVSNEFRGPLGVIREFTSILRDGLAGALNAEQHEYLDIIADQVDELTARVNDMLDIRRLEGGLFSVVRGPGRLPEIIRELQPMLERRAAARKVTLEFDVPQALPEIYGDAETIGRIVSNLTMHALGQAGDGGRVLLHTRVNPASEVIISVSVYSCTAAAGAGVRLVDEDEDTAERPADADMTDVPLGLEVALHMAHLNFGNITAPRGAHRGTAWELRLPLTNPALLTERYLESLRRLKRQPSHVSLIKARVALPAGSPLAGPMNDFLQRLMRCGDWVYQADEAAWLLTAAGTGGELERIVARVDKAWTDAGRHRPDGGWPWLQLEMIGTWPVSDAEREFRRRFLDCLNTSQHQP